MFEPYDLLQRDTYIWSIVRNLVNIGGKKVPDPFIIDSLFEIVEEM